ncbi:MAG: hypothetical protein J3K34DRAFT_519005 [Monoraphidium minutum]|nr:MAG: hypothetical protein J3K34DRAFT_519005 [Monoraphidium minutum]
MSTPYTSASQHRSPHAATLMPGRFWILVSIVICAKLSAAQECPAKHDVGDMPSAVVFGATGAIGEEMWRQLASSGAWSKVTTIGRRAPEGAAAAGGAGACVAAAEARPAAVHHVALDLGALGGPEAAAALQGADAVFCALGTTRGDAGSAEAFKRVDHEYVAAAAEASKKAGARYFGLVSAQGANPRLWASDLAPFHPLLYSRTKGLAEEAVKAQAFDAAGIFRPGLLDRGAKARPNERWFLKLVSAVAVGDVAKVMIADAERFLSTGAPPGAHTYEMGAIQRAAKAAAAPV